MTRLPVAVLVQYRYVEGLHVFTSTDVEGLYIADRDPHAAFERVAPAIRFLVKENEKVECGVEPAANFREFLMQLRAGASRSLPPALESRSFVLTPGG